MNKIYSTALLALSCVFCKPSIVEPQVIGVYFSGYIQYMYEQISIHPMSCRLFELVQQVSGNFQGHTGYLVTQP